MKLEKVPSDLNDAVAKIRRLEESLAAGGVAASEVGAEQTDAKPIGFADKMVGSVKSAAKQSSDRLQLNAAYMSLGRQAVEKYAEKAAPKELREELSVALQRFKALQEEVDALGKSASLGFWTPGRVAFGGIAVAVLLLLGVVRTLGGGASRTNAGGSTQAAATRSSDGNFARAASSGTRAAEETVWCQSYCTNCGYESSKVKHLKIYWDGVLKDITSWCNQSVGIGGRQCGGLVKTRLCYPPN